MRIEVVAELERLPREVPWESADGRQRFLDLRADPRALREIEEARRYAALCNFLAAVNSDDSVFATSRCSTQASGAPGTAAGCAFSSSIELFFAEEDFNAELRNFEDLANRVAELLARDASGEAQRARLAIRPSSYGRTKRAGFCLAVELAATGASPEQAELRWALGLARLQQALLFLSRVIRHNLPEAG
jgi:hypothetical protein